MRNKEVKKRIAASLIAASLILAGCTTKEEKEMKKLLEGDRYSEAADYYAQHSSRIGDESRESMLKEAIERIREAYLEKKMTCSSAVDSLNALYSLGSETMESAISETIASIENLEQSRMAFQQAEKYYQEERYLYALEKYADVIEEDEENYETAQSKMEECVSLYKKQVLSQAAAFFEEGEYDSAIDLLEETAEYYMYNEDKDIQSFLSKYRTEWENETVRGLLSDTMERIEKGDFFSALKQIDGLLADYPENAVLTDLRNSTATSYLDTVLPLIREYMSEEKYAEAHSICSGALSVLKDSSELQALRDELEPLRPVLLSELTISESACFDELTDRTEVYKDVVGNRYYPGNLYRLHLYHDGWGNDDDGYAKVYLNSQYKKMKATVALDDSSDTGSCILSVYGDDSVLYSGEFSRTTPPEEISIDVTGTQWIEFSITYPEEDTHGYQSNIFISGVGFYR